MLVWMTGTASPVTTADTLRAEKTPTTALTANGIITKNARHIVASAKKQCAWAAVVSARTAKSLCARIASADTLSVKNCAVSHALKMVFVQTVKKKWRKKMKNKNAKSQKLTKTEVQANLKQAKQSSSSQVEKNSERTRRPALKFSPTAWAKLLYFRDKSDNEVSGFGITEPDDLLCVRDFITVKQEVTPVSVKFDDEAVADLFENQVDLGRRSEQFARIWLHSHPGDSPEPSIIDKETFERVFGGCQWAVMFILARNNHTYAKLSFNVRPGGYVLIPTAIDYSHEFGPSSRKEWDAKYSANIQVKNLSSCYENREHTSVEKDLDRYALPCDFVDELESMNPTECQFILDELGARPDLWDDEREVIF